MKDMRLGYTQAQAHVHLDSLVRLRVQDSMSGEKEYTAALLFWLFVFNNDKYCSSDNI